MTARTRRASRSPPRAWNRLNRCPSTSTPTSRTAKPSWPRGRSRRTSIGCRTKTGRSIVGSTGIGGGGTPLSSSFAGGAGDALGHARPASVASLPVLPSVLHRELSRAGALYTMLERAMSAHYDPRSAVKALIDTAQRNQPRIVSSNVPGIGSGLVDERGESYAKPAKPERSPVEGLCVLVRSLEDGTSTLPDDFADVPLTREGLRAHVRPDGGVCLGFFGNSYEDAVIVYGDPLMSQAETKRIVLAFWQQAKAGPFTRPPLEVVVS